ncbi:hypothetical protein [Endozoicomonas sp.]|uniref:hypothetical protein n=1 Tax=Endozoicomonas sp. TaxID=1892382 RepID=UPI003AF9F4A3
MTTPVSSHTELWTNICQKEKVDIDYQLNEPPLDKNGVRIADGVSLHDQRKNSPLKKACTQLLWHLPIPICPKNAPFQLSSKVGCWLQFSVAAVGTALIGLSVSIVTAPVGMAASYLLGCPKSFADWTIKVCQVTLSLFINPITDRVFPLIGFYVVTSVAGVIPTVAWAGLMVYEGIEIYSAFRNDNFEWVEKRDKWLMTSTYNEIMRDYIAPFQDMNGKDLKDRVVALSGSACRFCKQSIDQFQSVLSQT